ncbi:D-alanine---D-alanine ligase [Synchytrium microbalum]|uniref:D-alanine---D-alanine ligase n=1 Tax=Synchytrium microbalum TaxID=1806994 RepID=A0A507C9R0_9FUNG|nr:D-alanine---D-alanine ligase [Synchytrium microbalum]TPX34714.1 D-alanine---D-alanine ligase [Synchytrium microbalum]
MTPTTTKQSSDSTLADVTIDPPDKINDKVNHSTNGHASTKCHGRVADLEAMVPGQWWKTVFADGMYLKTDGDVVEDPEITMEEIAMLEQDSSLRNIFSQGGDQSGGPVAKVLDLCCGQGRHTLCLAEKYPNLQLFGHDQSAYLISVAQERATQQKLTENTVFTVGDCRQIPYADTTFDLVLVMGNSFGYFATDESDNHVLEEIHRVLKPGGRIVLDLTDGGYMRKNFAERSWEWIDDMCFVCRERQLSKDERRLSSREVITVTNRGVVRDQFYQERLYAREEVQDMLYSAGFDVWVENVYSEAAAIITTAKDMSKRNEDLGMMEQRMFVKASRPVTNGEPDGLNGQMKLKTNSGSMVNSVSLSSSDSSPASSPPSPKSSNNVVSDYDLKKDFDDTCISPVHNLPYANIPNFTVIFGDASIPCIGKLNNSWNREDLETRSKLIQALEELGYSLASESNSDGIRILEKHSLLISDIKANLPGFVFNLCDEGYLNDSVKELHIPALLDLVGVKYSGAGPNCLSICYDKGVVNSTASAIGIPTPRETYYFGGFKTGSDSNFSNDLDTLDRTITEKFGYPAFVKPVKGDNSYGINERSIVTNREDLQHCLEALRQEYGVLDVIVQEYLDGKEFSVGVIGNIETGLHFLPTLEVDYSRVVDQGLPAILGYASKWDPDSPYWRDVSYIPTLSLSPQDEADLKASCVILWQRFGFRDYGRFDFRRRGVDGPPLLLEVNPNPGWCHDGKMAHMSRFEGKQYNALILEILEATHKRLFGDSNHVYGLKSDIRDNILYLDDNTVIYPAGSNIIISNFEQHVQRFVPVSERGDGFSAIAVSPDKHLFAVAERGPTRASIHVYDVQNFRKRKTLVPASESYTAKEFSHLYFSPDSKFLVAQLGQPENVLHYFAWEKGKVISSIPIGTGEAPKTVRQVSVNPSDGTLVCVSGEGLFAVYRYTDGSFTDVPVNGLSENQDYRAHTWISQERLAVGTNTGMIYVLEDFAVCQEINVGLDCIESIVPIENGFATGGQGGSVMVFEWINEGTSIHQQVPKRKNAPIQTMKEIAATMVKVVSDGYHLTKQVALPDESVGIRTMTSSVTHTTILCELENNQILKLTLAQPETDSKEEASGFKPLSQPFHHGAVTGLDLCCRKPLAATCSADKSVRLWNYLTGMVELTRYFPDEPFSVALHPSGLYILIGFSDKLRLMNVLMDDLRLYKEFAVRACREVRFSNGGHLFAAAHGNAIQVFNTWTFDIIAVLKGHNGKVRSLHWTPDDQFLVSAGSDGAVYTWSVLDSKRESEHILKGCGYSSAVSTPDGKRIYAVGSDRMLKQITDSAVTCEIDCGVTLTQVILSHSGRMMFAGCSTGTVRAMKYPLSGDASDYQEHEAHSGAVTRFRLSYDDQFLFSTGEDGCLYQFRVSDREDRGMKRERGLQFADEILITKSDMEEKTASTLELQRSLEELKLEHEYQIRLRDMSFGERLKEVSEKHAQEVENLKISTSILRGEKDKEEARHEEEAEDLKVLHANELHDLETRFSTELMAEFDKFTRLQGDSSVMQNDWDAQVRQLEREAQNELSACSAAFESRLNKKVAEINKLQEELRSLQREHAETSRHLEEEADAESETLIQKYERKLRGEREEGARLKGENGIMRKKFLTLSKDIEDHRHEIARLHEEEKRLRAIVSSLEKDAAALKKEMGERDENIQEGERRMYDLKKKNQELEKFKFVLDFRIKELKEQVEPREQDISRMRDGIEEINGQLGRLANHKIRVEESIQALSTDLAHLRQDYAKEQRRAKDVAHRIRSFRSDLIESVQFIQEPEKLKKSVLTLFHKYCKADETSRPKLEPDVDQELTTHNSALWEDVKHLRAEVNARTALYRKEHAKAISENKELLGEINSLRRTVGKDASLAHAVILDRVNDVGPRRRSSRREPSDRTSSSQQLPSVRPPIMVILQKTAVTLTQGEKNKGATTMQYLDMSNYQGSSSHPGSPTFNYTGAFDQRSSTLLATWVAVYSLLLIWALGILLKYALIGCKNLFPYVPIGGRVKPSGIRTSRGIGATSSSAEEESETVFGGGAGEAEESERFGTWISRLDHVSDALRTNLLLLLAAATLISLPIEYSCATLFKTQAGATAISCGPCISNATSTISTILVWLFVAATMIWGLLELLVSDPNSASATRFAIVLLSQPLMIVIFIMAFARWSYLKGLECPEKASTMFDYHYTKDMYDLLVHGVNLL